MKNRKVFGVPSNFGIDCSKSRSHIFESFKRSILRLKLQGEFSEIKPH